MSALLLFIGSTTFLVTCLISYKKYHLSDKSLFCLYLATGAIYLAMLLAGFRISQNRIPPYLEILKYSIPIETKEFFIGKNPKTSRVILTDPAVDDVHAIVSNNGNKWRIQNSSVSRHIKLNDEYMNPALLKTGDWPPSDHETFVIEKEFDIQTGSKMCMGRRCYYIFSDNVGGKNTLSIQPIKNKPRIPLDNISDGTYLTKKGYLPYAKSVTEIPFSSDKLMFSRMKGDTLEINGKDYNPGDKITIINSSRDSITFGFVYPRSMSIWQFDDSPISGSLWAIIATILMISFFGLNILTGSLNVRTLYVYNFMILMCVMGLLVAGRMSAFDPRHSQWLGDYSKYSIYSIFVFLILTNWKLLKWPYLRFWRYPYQPSKASEAFGKPSDFERILSNKFFGRGISFYIGLFIILLFGLQKLFGNEQGVVLPIFGNFQPVFLCEILIVLVIAFWVQRNIEAKNLSPKEVIMINRDLPFGFCLMILPLYVLKDFAPLLIFGGLMLVSFFIRPNIQTWFKSLLIITLLVIIITIICFPNLLPATLESRIEVWKNPWRMTEKAAQFIQSLWIIKGIGFFGNGFGGTDILVNFPALNSDFITSLFIADFGTFGLIVLMLCWSGFFVTMFHQSEPDFDSRRGSPHIRFTKLIMLFIVFLFMFHCWLIMGSNLGVFPVMGIPLPFIARGFSCLVFLVFMGIGISVLCCNEAMNNNNSQTI